MASRHPLFERTMDVLIVVAILLGAVSTYRANDAENRTRDIARAAAVQAHENCVSLRQGRIDANDRNSNIIKFIELTIPPAERNNPATVRYLALANRLFGQKLEVPRCP